MDIAIHHPRPKGRPRKIIKQDKEDIIYQSDTSDKKEIAKIKYKHDNIEKIREQQNDRYNKIKAELAVKRLLHTIMSQKYSNEQRKHLLDQLSEQLKIKVETNDKQEVTVD